ncbi:MAG: AAA family ATPase, partial [Anaerolineales bacterium]
TDSTFSVFDLPSKEERQRKAMLSKVTRRLNQALTREWQNFRLDDTDALQINVEYNSEQTSEGTPRHFLKFDIIETDANGDEHFFFVRDRSKGFFWFFNFVMKLEFNPKAKFNTEVEAIYLLDEPGSYLHASAQSKLTKKIRNLTARNIVIYCTHSHHLLDPEVIPVSTIRIAEKNRFGVVSVSPIYEHGGRVTEKRSAFQPLLDALQIRPLSLDFGHEPVTITEGIIDYYLLEIFKGDRRFTIMPSVGASSMKYLISLMIAWRIEYRALWDNDDEGKEYYNDARLHFGDFESEKSFRLLPLKSASSRKRLMQDLVDGTDLKMIKTQLSLPHNTSFDKVIIAWFYSGDRNNLYKKISKATKENFDILGNILFPLR